MHYVFLCTCGSKKHLFHLHILNSHVLSIWFWKYQLFRVLLKNLYRSTYLWREIDIKTKILLHKNFVNRYGALILYLFDCSFFSFMFLILFIFYFIFYYNQKGRQWFPPPELQLKPQHESTCLMDCLAKALKIFKTLIFIWYIHIMYIPCSLLIIINKMSLSLEQVICSSVFFFLVNLGF